MFKKEIYFERYLSCSSRICTMPVSLERIERLKVMAVSAARKGDSIAFDDKEYDAIRRELLADSEQKRLLPKFILSCSTLGEVRQEMQALNDGTAGYKERERFIRDELSPLLNSEIHVQRDPFAEVVANTDLSKLGELPLDIQQKGKQGADCFVYLFCIENSIREFIVQVAVGKTLKMPRDVQRKIEARKQIEATRKYLPVRGTSDVYYCDFIELADIIKANWDVFAQYFPGKTEHWLTSMLEELYAVRLLIGHNSAVGENELKQLDVFYRVVMSYLRLN